MQWLRLVPGDVGGGAEIVRLRHSAFRRIDIFVRTSAVNDALLSTVSPLSDVVRDFMCDSAFRGTFIKTLCVGDV